ncbi:hypothetical protein [Dyadobacter sp. 3J3]|uniref:hypothetical protein n=1 Tax=Dyadobacter sp. 3J3 TaxID=2606600 RepID=UPI0013576920|nr:hypothetical protein [Dyadobacter sp. 3J3]
MKQNIKLSILDNNEGQIEGLPANPRFIKDADFLTLRQSIIDDPEFLDIREMVVIPFNKRFVIIGGNMRLKAIEEVVAMLQTEFDQLVESKRHESFFLDWFAAITMLRDKKEAPCRVLPKDTPTEKLRAYAVKDNLSFGKWDHDMLSSEWDQKELKHWGMDVPNLVDDKSEEDPIKGISKKLQVECGDVNKLEDLFEELQTRGFECILK